MIARRGPRAAALVLGVTLTGALAAAATEHPGLDQAGLIARSDVVVRVTVDKHEARWVTPRRIATLYEVRVVEVLRGELQPVEQSTQRLIVGLPGGAVGDIGQRVGGVPELHDGAEYVLFLGPGEGPGGARGVVGHVLGVLRTRGDRLLDDPVLGGHPELPRRLPRLRALLQPSRAAEAQP